MDTLKQPKIEDTDYGEACYRSCMLQILDEEMKLIGAAIRERNEQSTQIKQWCLTVWLAAWGVVSIEYFMESFKGYEAAILFAPTIFPVFFFWLELMNKRNERKFTFRATQIYHFLNAGNSSQLKKFLATSELGSFRFYDPAAMNWFREMEAKGDLETKERARFERWTSFLTVSKEAWGLAPFYGSLFIVTAVAAGLIWYIQQHDEEASTSWQIEALCVSDSLT